MTTYAVHIRERSTGRVRIYKYERDPYFDHKDMLDSYIWSEGNNACDHVRAQFFAAAANELAPEVDCDGDNYVVDKIVSESTGELVYYEELPCICGHDDPHDMWGGGACVVEGCSCKRYVEEPYFEEGKDPVKDCSIVCIVCGKKEMTIVVNKKVLRPKDWINTSDSEHGFMPVCGQECQRKLETVRKANGPN